VTAARGELARLFEESLSRYQAALAEATSESALRVVHARYAGKEGEIRKRLADALKGRPRSRQASRWTSRQTPHFKSGRAVRVTPCGSA
jgi:hypothetical protein